MANRQFCAPAPLFHSPLSLPDGSSTTNPPSTSHGPPSTSAHHLTNNPSPSHTQLWLSSSHKLTQLESAHTLTADEPSVFGPAHAKALEDLRAAQLQLAQAWMRSECEDRDLLDGEHAELAKRSFGRDGDLDGGEGIRGVEDVAGKDVAGSERGGELPNLMESDMLLARKRRELNDAHFNRVSLSVMDVIQKLEHVAGEMGVVESKSRDIWGGSELSDASSMK
ncbi:hypothetical protein EV426DRAFT_535788 [Tirmania nivea]|nr:hypothetical protein EV426DRAFT_535788 [Tirmania nivea]